MNTVVSSSNYISYISMKKNVQSHCFYHSPISLVFPKFGFLAKWWCVLGTGT